VPDPEAVRKEWARRVDEAYSGWPEWLTPGAGSRGLPWGPPVDEGAGDDEHGTAADVPAGTTAAGFSWDIPPDELEDVDRRLWLRQRTARIARALRAERGYWGLTPEGG
jgi:hypothetical protein